MCKEIKTADPYIEHMKAVLFVEAVVRVIGVKWTQFEKTFHFTGRSYRWRKLTANESVTYLDASFIDAATDILGMAGNSCGQGAKHLFCVEVLYDYAANVKHIAPMYAVWKRSDLIEMSAQILYSDKPAKMLYNYIFGTQILGGNKK